VGFRRGELEGYLEWEAFFFLFLLISPYADIMNGQGCYVEYFLVIEFS